MSTIPYPRVPAFKEPLRLIRRPAWVLLLVMDVLGIMAPSPFLSHGRFELLSMAVVSAVLFQGGGLYRPQLKLSVLDDAPRLVTRSIAAAIIVGAMTAVIGYEPVLSDFFLLAVMAVVLHLLSRAVAYTIIRRARSRGSVAHSTLVVGGGAVADRIVNRLAADRTYGLRPIGFLDHYPRPPVMASGVPFRGPTSELPRQLDATHARVVIVAFTEESDAELIPVLRASERRQCDVFVVPRLFEIYNYGQTDHIGAIPVVRLWRPRLTRSARLLKRAVDVSVSGAALLVLSPVLALVAYAVRREGGPGVIFRQVRVGLDNREFELMKFRTLAPVDDAESATRWNISDDERMGRVGRILRRTSIDELPQLWNILRGDMTLVGPRPERPHFARTFTDEIPDYALRHRMRAGLTGLAQVNGLRGDTSIADRARYDNFYIENWSMWLDMKIICGTVREVVGARGK
ncbi:MAG TPA: sugar transferase [Acidimicrobiia bacterium]